MSASAQYTWDIVPEHHFLCVMTWITDLPNQLAGPESNTREEHSQY